MGTGTAFCYSLVIAIVADPFATPSRVGRKTPASSIHTVSTAPATNVGGPLFEAALNTNAAAGLPNLRLGSIYISNAQGDLISPVVGHRFWVRAEFFYDHPICNPYSFSRTVNGFSNTSPPVVWGCGESGETFAYWHNWGSWVMHKQGRYTITVTVDGDNAVAESDESDNTLTVGFDFAGVVTPEWSRVQAEEGRTLLGDGTDVIVASMDDAFDFNHPWVSGTDSKGRPRLIAAYQNAFGPDGSPINAVHSTALMGIVLARGSNSGDITGMAPDARYVSAEFLNRAGISGHGVRHVFDAAGLVADSGAEVINMSWSWWSGSDFASQTGETSLTNLMADYLGYGRNIVCVAAINQLDDFMRPTAPGSSRNVITVGGLHDDLVHAWELQDHGPTLDGRSKPDLLGNDSENAVAMDPAWREGFPAAEGWWGTSFSAPFVTGAAAQMLDYGKHHGESTDHRVIKAIIMNSGVKTSGSKGQPWASSKSQPLDPEQGTGVLNMVRVHQMYSCGKQSPGVIGSKGYDLGEVSGTASTGEGFQLYRLGTPITPNAVLDFTLVWDRHTFWNDANQSGRIDEGDSFFTTATDRQDNLDLALLYFGAEVKASRSVVDTVEHLHLEELPMGFYEIRVERLPVTNSGADESYALAWHSPDAWAFCDSEGDGDNDLLDAAAFQNCFASQLPTCLAPFDLDRNDEIALSDLSLMVITSTGPK